MRRPIFVALSLVTATGACTSLLGDFTLGGSGPGTDGGQDGTTSDGPSSNEGGEAGTVTAVAEGTNAYYGQMATLDGTQSTATEGTLQFSWALLTKPSGSGIGTQSLSSPSPGIATFKPDALGEYKWELSVTAGDAPPGTALVTVYCGLPQVFYAQGTGGSQGPYASYDIVDLDGGNAHPVMCLDTAPTDPASGTDIPAFASYAGRAYDFWEAPPIDPAGSNQGSGSRLAGFTVDYVSGNYSTHLWTATSTSACDGGLTDFTSTGFGPGKPFGSEPHFRPDGERFAVYDTNWNILTYQWNDTTSGHSVAGYPYPYQPPPNPQLDPTTALGSDGGILQTYFQVPPRIEWITPPDGGTWQLAWAFPHATMDGGSGWTIAMAPDQSNASPMPYIECPGVVPRQFSILADGSIIAAYRQTPTSAEDIVHLKPMTGGGCTLLTNYTSLAGGVTSIATDFSISPDGNTIAFLRLDPSGGDSVQPWLMNGAQLPGGYLFTVPVSGGQLTQVTAEPALFGPRWIGGGSQLVFTRLDKITAAGTLATSVVVVAPTGGSPVAVAQGDGVTTFVSTSGNAACGIGPGNAAGGAAGLIGLVGLAAFARRRRRRR